MAIIRNIILVLLFVGCGANMDYVLDRAKKINKNGEFISFNTLDSNGDQLSMNKGGDKVTLLIFSGQYCYSCIKETERFIASLNDPDVAPAKINIITLVVLAEVIDADDFKFFNQVPWTVGIDHDQSLVQRYCGTVLVPCLVVQDPVRGILMTHIGEMPLDKLKQFTGEWE